MTIDRLVGNPHARTLLARLVAGDRVPGALLLHGPPGVGKAQAALAVARALQCERGRGCDGPTWAPADGEAGPRGCEPCDKIDRGVHPDVVWIAPDGAFIKIEQVRELAARLAYPPHEGKRRVVIIDCADRMNPPAQNALLKSLEEPRADTHFLLVTAAPHALLPTVLSRCQRIAFAPLADADVADVLRGLGVDADRIRAVAPLAEGSAGRALALAEGDAIAARRETALTLHRASAGRSAGAAFAASSSAGNDREEVDATLAMLGLLYRDAARVAESAPDARLGAGVPDDVRDAAALGRGELGRRFRLVTEAQQALAGNAAPGLVLDHLVLAMGRIAAP